ncbi:unnamed protein product [Ectocarpus sp. 12 AP-2014]
MPYLARLRSLCYQTHRSMAGQRTKLFVVAYVSGEGSLSKQHTHTEDRRTHVDPLCPAACLCSKATLCDKSLCLQPPGPALHRKLPPPGKQHHPHSNASKHAAEKMPLPLFGGARCAAGRWCSRCSKQLGLRRRIW